MIPAGSILDAMDDPALFAPHFRVGDWKAWRAFLAALFALPMDDEALALYRACTGRTTPPTEPFDEADLIIGRRGGKSRALGTTAVYLATFRDWRPYLAAGEKGYVVIVAADRRQCRVILGYVRALLAETPLLAPLIAKDNAEDIELTNGVIIEVATCSHRTIRGRTVIAGLCDEAAFWSTDDGSANPDVEVLNALRPAMATVPGAVLLIASSPYARRGALWSAYRRHYGKDGAPVLVWKAPTRTMNPGVPQHVIDEAMEADPASATAEYLAEFRTDVESFISREAIEAAVVEGRHELPPVDGIRYFGFVDPSGGSADSMTLAVAHAGADDRAILDAVRERRPPFSPEAVVAEFAELLKSYALASVTGDRYAGEWPRERFRIHGVEYQLARDAKSQIYQAFLPIINSGKAELLDIPRLTAQLVGLERRTARGGRDSIDHAPGGHDDIANAVAGALTGATATVPPWLRPVPIVAPIIVSSYGDGFPADLVWDGSANFGSGGFVPRKPRT